MNRFELYRKSVIRKEVDKLRKKKGEPNTAAEKVAEPSSESKSEKSVSEPFTIYIIPWVHMEQNKKKKAHKKSKKYLYLQYSYDYFLLFLCLESIPLVKIMRN